ncbi:TetR family transcriptional regulator [Paraburkholderia phenoliruptrix]|uniref:TetR family transcriptional regulator n=1 Tax=Paraburkholderia phenoliruptrix TaxID=252970 RepID=UPI002869DFBC|nr:TetR family transcriptional regulator [Paraburkholderia phenoliruptrix]WMY12114.1 TetR family transcriptional regulator [Paraburkholderia phenoliruptrix]
MKKGSKAAEPDTNGIPSDAPRKDNGRSDVRRTDARRKYDPEQTKRNILDVATQEFSAMGLTGARVDAIAERTNTTKRMLYYYFGSKEGLYQAVLEKVYGDIRALEQDLHVSELDPVEGMRALVEFTFDYHDRQRDFVRLVTIENINGAKYVEHSKSFKGRNVTVIHTIEDLLARGVAAGQFRNDIDAIDLHLLISSLCFHRIGNRHTFGTAFGRDPSHPRLRARHRAMIVDAVLRFVRKED